MKLIRGTRLGPYEIVDLLGAGGMGEVYRARDARLNREVALKVLAEAFASDPDRLARFQREAHILASLNHAHIAAIYGLEQDGDQPAVLVMEFVAGEDLSRRIARGPIPIEEALPIAAQIAEALEAAHDAGVIHRDLKPANIKLRPDGTVKVLDFGLAKAADASGAGGQPESGRADSPTITTPAMTAAGIILGTAAYMSPEQAKGRPVDKRADVWAFGAVLYEMLTGLRAFDGEDVGDTLAAILRATPDWTRLPPQTPASIRRLLRRSLEKDVRSRLSDMAMVRTELRDAATESDDFAPIAVGRVARRSSWTLAASSVAGVLLAAATGVAVWSVTRSPGPSQPLMHLSIELPNDQQFSALDRNLIAISPDGSRVVYGANHRLYLRALDQPIATPVAGTDAGTEADSPRAPFFSPDGTWIAFWQGGALKKVSVSGGEPLTITRLSSYVGASWGPDDRILLGGADGAYQVGANDGTLTRAIAAKNNERTSSPFALPGGEWVLMVVHLNTAADRGQVVVQSRASGERQLLIDGARDVRYLSSGHLVFARDAAIFAQAFNAASRTLSGEPVQVLQGVANAGTVPLAQVAVSSTGTLVYVPGSPGDTTAPSALVQVARDGTRSTLVELKGMMWFPRYSPDGSRVAYGLNASPADGSDPSDLWVLDVARGARTRVTFEGNNRFYPIWTRDGTRLTFADTVTSTNSMRWALADGSGGLHTFAEPRTGGLPTSWSPDGRALAYYVRTEANRRDIWILEVDGDKRTARPFVTTPYEERGAIFSPNGRWIAYVSNKSDQNDVYARPYPGPGAEVTISVGGGQEPVWGPSGRELFYRRGGKLLVVEIDERDGSLVVGSPAVVFDDRYRLDTGGAAGGVANYDISPDGNRFVMVEEPNTPASTEPRLNVILNWGDELKRRLPTR